MFYTAKATGQKLANVNWLIDSVIIIISIEMTASFICRQKYFYVYNINSCLLDRDEGLRDRNNLVIQNGHWNNFYSVVYP